MAPGPAYLSTPLRVRWNDCDPAGIIFFARYFEMAEAAALHLARAIALPRDAMLPPGLLALAVTRAEAEFLAPALLDDEIDLRTRVRRVAESEVDLDHEFRRGGAVLARLTETRQLIHGPERVARAFTAGQAAALRRLAAQE